MTLKQEIIVATNLNKILDICGDWVSDTDYNKIHNLVDEISDIVFDDKEEEEEV